MKLVDMERIEFLSQRAQEKWVAPDIGSDEVQSMAQEILASRRMSPLVLAAQQAVISEAKIISQYKPEYLSSLQNALLMLDVAEKAFAAGMITTPAEEAQQIATMLRIPSGSDITILTSLVMRLREYRATEGQAEPESDEDGTDVTEAECKHEKVETFAWGSGSLETGAWCCHCGAINMGDGDGWEFPKKESEK